MGKPKNATKGQSDVKNGISSTLLSHVVEAGNTGDVVHDLGDEVTSLEDALSQMDTSSKMSFCLCVVAHCHPNDLYHLSIDKIIQHMRIRHAILSKLE